MAQTQVHAPLRTAPEVQTDKTSNFAAPASLVAASVMTNAAGPTSSSSREKTATTAGQHTSMAEPELLALIVEMRLSAGRPSNGNEKDKKSTTSSSADPTGDSAAADTMDLCHKKIQKLPEEMVDIIKDDIVRLALGYNFISALPSSFVELSKLRYLNIRANLMSTFPAVLCDLPSLEILDMSRNKIRKFPDEPGRLTELRVLSLANNRLRKLPTWLSQSRHLRILKVEGNPITWPPPHVTVMPPLNTASMSGGNEATVPLQDERERGKLGLARKKAEDKHMLVWIAQLKSWIKENAGQAHVEEDGDTSQKFSHKSDMRGKIDATGKPYQEGNVVNGDPQNIVRPNGEREGGSDEEKQRDEEEILLRVTAPTKAASGVVQSSEEVVQVAEQPSASLDETQASTSRAESPRKIGTAPSHPSVVDVESAARGENVVSGASKRSYSPPPPSPSKAAAVPPLPMPSPQTTPSSATHPSPNVPKSVSEAALKLTPLSTLSTVASSNTTSSVAHSRNNSHSVSQSGSSLRPLLAKASLSNKKSLPDMRLSAATKTATEMQTKESFPDDVDKSNQRIRKTSDPSKRSPLSITQTEVLSDANTRLENSQRKRLPPIVPASDPKEKQDLQRANDAQSMASSVSNIIKTATAFPSDLSTSAHQQIVEAVESERNSYFKRLSTLPASTISVHVSVPVLLCVDATRGVLYALSQMHTALRQYVAFATEERMTSQLSRVLDIAGTSMATLIHSLDRFDSLSRIKGDALDPSVVRGVIVSCIESIATFRKLVHVVQLQLKSFQRGADIRYTRTLLLLLYGSLAEIANSWKTMEPLLNDVAPYLKMGEEAIEQANDPQQFHATTTTPHTTYTQPGLPSIAESTSPVTPSSRSRAAAALSSRPPRRRHAGSFSAQDIAQGASMASANESLPVVSAMPATAIPAMGEERRMHRSTLTQLSAPPDLAESGLSGPANSGAQGGRTDNSSRRTLSSTTNVSRGAGMYMGSHSAGDEPPVDDHLLMLVVKITSVAFSVWAGIEDHLISLGLPAAANGQSIKASIAMASYSAIAPHGKRRSGEISEAGQAAFSSIPRTPLRSARSARQEVSEASTVGDSSVITHSGTPSNVGNASQSTDPEATLIGSTPRSATSQHAHAASNTSSAAGQPSPAVQRRLRQLHDLTRGVNEHTHRLHACLERTQDAMGHMTASSPLSPPLSNAGLSTLGTAAVRHLRNGSTVSSSAHSNTNSNTNSNANSTQNGASSEREKQQQRGGNVSLANGSDGGNRRDTTNGHEARLAGGTGTGTRELFLESSQFIKSVLHISHFIKGLAAEGFVLPKYVKASIAELTTNARDLTLHLHFLSGPAPSVALQVAPQPQSAAATFAPTMPLASTPMSANTLATAVSAPADVVGIGSLQSQQHQQH